MQAFLFFCYHGCMIRDVLPFKDAWSRLRPGVSSEAINAFVSFIERRTGAFVGYDTTALSSSDTDLLDLMEISDKLIHKNILHSYSKIISEPDEPPIFHWRADFGIKNKSVAGG